MQLIRVRSTSVQFVAALMASVLHCLVPGCVYMEQSDIAATTTGRNALFIVDNPHTLNTSDAMVRTRLATRLGFSVTLVDDDNVSAYNAAGFDVMIVSKTVTSTKVGSRYKQCSCGFLTWEDNLQRSQMMALIDNDGSTGTAWHGTGTTVYVVPAADTFLSAGASGNTVFYTQTGEITYAPKGHLAEDAQTIAQWSSHDGRTPYYVYEKGARIADGSTAAGRRVYFGLYDDTFRYLTADGLKLFDAAVLWAADVAGRRRGNAET